MKTTSFDEWMAGIQVRSESALQACLPSEQESPARLHEAMRYAVLGGGKRVRPLLAFAAGEVTAADETGLDRLDIVACAVELIHAYSLVHDDLPCMDNDVLRRGRPTCHVAFDEATALLVGDALQTHAFQLLAQARDFDPQRQLQMLALLAEASGSRGMAGGQAIDLAAVGVFLDQQALEEMHARKTGALIRAAILLGATCGDDTTSDSTVIQSLETFSRHVGLLFQVVDDVLDATTDSQTLGKTAGKDAAANKPTFVSFMGLDAARRYADQLKNAAHAALAPLGEKALRLRQLTDFIADRHS